ncbi:hypothetical protein JCM17478_32280 [Thermopirellula anaerolimosa]
MTIRDASTAADPSQAGRDVGEVVLDLGAEQSTGHRTQAIGTEAASAEIQRRDNADRTVAAGPEIWVEDAPELEELPGKATAKVQPTVPEVASGAAPPFAEGAGKATSERASLPDCAEVERLSLSGTGGAVMLHLRPTEKFASTPFASAESRPSRNELWMRDAAIRESAMNRGAVRACLPWLSPTVMGNLRRESPGRVPLPSSLAAASDRTQHVSSCLAPRNDRDWIAEPAIEEIVIRDRELRLVAGQERVATEGVEQVANGVRDSQGLVQTGLDWPAADTRVMESRTDFGFAEGKEASARFLPGVTAPPRESTADLKVMTSHPPVGAGPVELPVNSELPAPRYSSISSWNNPQRSEAPGSSRDAMPTTGAERDTTAVGSRQDRNRNATLNTVVTESSPHSGDGTPGMKVLEFSPSQSAAASAATPLQQAPGFAEMRVEETSSGASLVEEVPSSQEHEMAGELLAAPFEIIEESGELTVIVRRSKLLRTKVDVYRTAVVDPAVCDVSQFTPREIAILGKGQGATHVTFWFADERYRPVTYLVRVKPDPEIEKQQTERYSLLQSHLARLFPESKVELTAVGDKLIVRGQARDAAEAAQIMAVIRGELVRARGVAEGQADDPVGRMAAGQDLPALQVINLLRIPGPAQVALKVKIAELNRTAARNFGVDMKLNLDQGKFLIQSLLNLSSSGTASILGTFDGGDLKFGIHYLEEHGVLRMLSEPTLVTLSGRPATFIAGGEFAVPTAVGVNGVGAVTTDFRAYGAIITFLPTVLDKDLIRLEVSPEFSQIDNKNKVNGTPGLRTRAVTTTVEMREGQTLALAGLLDDSMSGNNQGDLPIVAQIFGRRSMSRNETELIILVTPELVHPMEPEETPPLPGFDVTEPTNHEFFIKGHLEGRPTAEYDGTTWPNLRRRYNAGGPAMISGPFGHGD